MLKKAISRKRLNIKTFFERLIMQLFNTAVVLLASSLIVSTSQASENQKAGHLQKTSKIHRYYQDLSVRSWGSKNYPNYKELLIHRSLRKNKIQQTKKQSPVQQKQQLTIQRLSIDKNIKTISATLQTLNNHPEKHIMVQTSDMDKQDIATVIYNLRHEKITDAFTKSVNQAGLAITQKKDLASAQRFITGCAKSSVALNAEVKTGLRQLLHKKIQVLEIAREKTEAQLVALQQQENANKKMASSQAVGQNPSQIKQHNFSALNTSSEQDEKWDAASEESKSDDIPDSWEDVCDE
jgi:hypothetical protein